MRRRAVPLLILALTFIAGFGLLQKSKPSRAQTDGQTASSTQPVAATSTGTVATYTAFCGLWRVDGGFQSTIEIKNSLVVAPLDVTPVLYLADGAEYDLPPVHLAPTAVATVSVNQALANASPEVASHLSSFGSAALRYQYTSPGHVLGAMQILNIPQSLIFISPFSGVAEAAPAVQTLEGLWWRHDPDVGGFVSLANATNAPADVTLQAIGSRGTALRPQSLNLAAHGTQLLSLDTLVAGLPGLENQAGGLRVQYNGKLGEVMVTGGLVNEREGYSANMPFWGHDLSTSDPTQITYASVGVRAGPPDPAAGFPGGTKFMPYTALRNTTSKPLTVTPVLNTMSGGQPVSTALPNQQLNPFETRQLDLESIFDSAGFDKLSGSLNLSLAFTGHGGDLVFATGSVDQTGTYVFEVEPQGVGRSFSKEGADWKVANGFDTVYSLWNPTASAQDYLVTFHYGDGSGKYNLPVRLEAQASTTIDMAALIAGQVPDADGHVIPPNIREGSVMFASAKGLTEWMTLAASGGVFNVQTATCGAGGLTCITCNGFSNFVINATSGSAQLTAQCTYSDGTVYDETTSCNWTSDNTSLATVGNGSSAGLVSAGSNIAGNTTGTANITATFPSLVVFTGQICGTTGQPYCPEAQPAPSINIQVSIWTGKLNSSTSLSCFYAEFCPNGTSASCPPSQIPFILPLPAPSPCPQYVEVDDFYVVINGVKKCFFIAFEFNPVTPRNCQ